MPIQLPPTLGCISQHKRLFHIFAISSKVLSQWAWIGDDRSAEKRKSENYLAFAFELSVAWKLKSPKRRNWQNVTVNYIKNVESSEKSLSTIKPSINRHKAINLVTRGDSQNDWTKKEYSDTRMQRNIKPFACDNSKSASSACGSWQSINSVVFTWIREVGNGNTIVRGKPRLSHR